MDQSATIKSGTWRNEQIRDQQMRSEPLRAPHGDAPTAPGKASRAAGMERTLRGWQLLLKALGVDSAWSGIQPPAIPDGAGRLIFRLPSGKDLAIVLQDRPLDHFLQDRANRAWASQGHWALIVPSSVSGHASTYSVVPDPLAHEAGGRGRWFDGEADSCSPGTLLIGQESGELSPSPYPLLWWRAEDGQTELRLDHPERPLNLLRGGQGGRPMTQEEAGRTYRVAMAQAMAEETWPQAKPWEIMSQKLPLRGTGWTPQQAEEISRQQEGRAAARLHCHRVVLAELLGPPRHPQLDVVPKPRA